MKLNNVKSPEMARFLLMMLTERWRTYADKTLRGNRGFYRIKELNHIVSSLESYLDIGDCSYNEAAETRADILSYKNEIQQLEQEFNAGEQARKRAEKINVVITQVRKIVDENEKQAERAKTESLIQEKRQLNSQINRIFCDDFTDMKMEAVKKKEKRIADITNILQQHRR